MATTVIVQEETVKVSKVGVDNIADSIHGTSEKTVPIDADEVGLLDSAASWVLKNLTWANIKTVLKAYFDTLYAGLGTNSDITSMTGLDDDGIPVAKVSGAVARVDLIPPVPKAFAGSNGVTITHNYGHTDYQLSINPSGSDGFLGEIWLSKSNNTVIVYNTGSATVDFDYVITPAS